MKKAIILILIALTVVTCKRKQSERELEHGEKLVQYPGQCYNGTQDSTESGIDCGGPCAACNVVVAPCTTTANIVTIGSVNYATTGSSCGISGGNYTMQGSYSNGTYTIQIGNSAPDISNAYNVVYSSVPGVIEASVIFNDSSYGNLMLVSGSVYFSQVGGVYHATICNGVTHSWVTSTDMNLVGNVSCP